MVKLGHVFFLAFVASTQAAELPTSVLNNSLNVPYHAIQPRQAMTFESSLTTDSKSKLPNNLSLTFKVSTDLKTIASKIIKDLLKVVRKIGAKTVVVLFLAFLGIGFTAAVCTHTNLCSSSYSLDPELVQDAMRAYMSPHRLSSLTDFVHSSIQDFANKS